jgi:hypothetical protein
MRDNVINVTTRRLAFHYDAGLYSKGMCLARLDESTEVHYYKPSRAKRSVNAGVVTAPQRAFLIRF